MVVVVVGDGGGGGGGGAVAAAKVDTGVVNVWKSYRLLERLDRGVINL